MDYLKQLAKKILQYQAKLVLKKYKPKVIAITGSVGKTLTKDAIYNVLSKKYFVRKSEKSFTAELGIPLAIIGCHDGVGSIGQFLENILLGFYIIIRKTIYPEWLILEIDGDKPGDFGLVSKYLSPDILVMTAIGDVPSHIELFYDIETFVSEKKMIIDSVKSDGLIVYNSDDELVGHLLAETKIKKISCGVGGDFDIVATDFEILYGNGKVGSIPTGMAFEIKEKETGDKFNINIFDSIGVQNQYSTLLAFAIGKFLGIDKKDIVKVLNRTSPTPGRMNLVPGIKDTLIIDDSYNSSPIAMSQAIQVLKNIKSVEKKVAVVGDMLELGRYSATEHRRVAEQLNGVATDVICVGIRTRKTVEELLNLGFPESKINSYDTSEEVGNYLQNMISEGDIILVKGSQAMRMEKVVEEIMKYPQDAKKVLVRQEDEWKGR
jgi:UDP-N-acetylmuramoyl-tripeptide--D-alanyl-D-alanine ligase